jgi:hypothetical protein
MKVGSNYFVNWQQRRLGRWRPSVAARRIGARAIAIERFMSQNGVSGPEAVQLLSASSDVDVSLLRRLRPHGLPRVFNGGLIIEEVRGRRTIDISCHAGDEDNLCRRVEWALAWVVSGLAAFERRLLIMRFGQRLTTRAIAKADAVRPRHMYDLFAKLLRKLRQQLEDAGVTADDVQTILDGPGLDVHLVDAAGEERQRGRSTEAVVGAAGDSTT